MYDLEEGLPHWRVVFALTAGTTIMALPIFGCFVSNVGWQGGCWFILMLIALLAGFAWENYKSKRKID